MALVLLGVYAGCVISLSLFAGNSSGIRFHQFRVGFLTTLKGCSVDALFT